MRAGGIVTVGLCLLFFQRVWRSLPALPDLPLSLGALAPALGIALALLLLTQLLGALMWLPLLRSLERPASGLSHLAALVGSFFVAQFSRYLPGNVMHQIGRAVLAKRLGYSLTASAASQVLEMVLLVAVGGAIGLVGLADVGGGWLGPQAEGNLRERLPWLGLLALGAVSLSPLLLRVVSRRVPALAELDPRGLPAAALLSASLAACTLVLTGLSVYVLGQALAPQVVVPIWVVASRVVLAWLAGMLAPGAPAGLGVREFMLLQALSPIYGEPVALLLSLGLRLLGLISDLVTFLLGLAATVHLRRKLPLEPAS